MAVVLSTLTACANGPAAKDLEQSLAADSRLQSNPKVFGDTNNQKISSVSKVELPADFPKEIPIYPNAQLAEIKPVNKNSDNSETSENTPINQIFTRWQSADPINMIANFYSSEFKNQNWQILQQPKDDTEGTFEVKGNDLLLKVAIKPKTFPNPAPNQPQTATELTIEYTLNNTLNNTINNSNSVATNSGRNSQAGDSQFIGPASPGVDSSKQPTNTEIPASENSQPQEFSDLRKVPPEWRKQIEDLGKLGVLSIAAKPSNSSINPINNQLFEPDKIITRREFARWLITANNVMYSNNTAKKIRLASTNTQPAFRDVLPKDPDFPVIQGLAEAGLIPSSLSGDTTAVLFLPDAPLTRENLLMWKVPLDTRQALPNANLEAVKQSWGFQDTEKIDPKALRAILADFQNAEQSNIRRVFGYTTIFQPKKAVTRGEAAAAISYFGLQSEGMSTTEALKLKRE